METLFKFLCQEPRCGKLTEPRHNGKLLIISLIKTENNIFLAIFFHVIIEILTMQIFSL